MLRLFLPHQLLAGQSGHLIGWHLSKDDLTTVFVLAIGDLMKPEWARFQDHIGVVGIYVRNGDASNGPRPIDNSRSRPFVCVRLTDGNCLRVMEARVDGRRLSISGDCLLVLYDPQSYTAMQPEMLKARSSPRVALDQYSEDILVLLFQAITEFKRMPATFRSNFTSKSEKRPLSLQEAFSQCLFKVVSCSAHILCTVLKRSALVWLFEQISHFSHVGNQMKTRVLHLEYLSSSKSRADCELKYWNTVAAVSLDVILGLILMSLWHRTISTGLLLDFFLDWTNLLVAHLRTLLSWLTGVPAGLKLNSPLSSAMGIFFLYHIYLWEAYLFIIKPVLETMLDVGFYCGIFGVTFQFCLLKDLLALATFHVYCFYAYAVRIYNINFVGLVSYWRLFRGKKWNPLRERVDSCTYDVDQLFMGTLCFTTLFFLLPTTLLYYSVFTMLRIPILLVQGLIHKIVVLIDFLPLYTLILRSMNSKALVGDVHFVVIPRLYAAETAVVLMMKGSCCSWAEATLSFRPPMNANSKVLPWKTFFKNILSGKLIYPI